MYPHYFWKCVNMGIYFAKFEKLIHPSFAPVHQIRRNILKHRLDFLRIYRHPCVRRGGRICLIYTAVDGNTDSR